MKGNNRLPLADHEAHEETPYWSIIDGKYKGNLTNILRTSPPYEPTNLRPIYYYNCFEIRAMVSLPL
jgi:hypothetical protein